jgi:ferritin-like metal-binding protein YciE
VIAPYAAGQQGATGGGFRIGFSTGRIEGMSGEEYGFPLIARPAGARQANGMKVMMKTLQNLFLDQLAAMNESEHQIAQALTWMTPLTSDEELQRTLRHQAHESAGHISRVAQVFGCFGEEAVRSKSNAISGLLAEAEAMMAQYEGAPARDAVIVSAAQKLKHYEMAAYGCLQDWAVQLNNRTAANLLGLILEEKKSGSCRLASLDHLGKFEERNERGWRVESIIDEAKTRAGHGPRFRPV